MDFWEALLQQGFAAEYNPETGIFSYPDGETLREIVTVAAYKSLQDKAYLRVEFQREAGKHRDAFFLLPKRKLPPVDAFYPAISGNIVDDWLVNWGMGKRPLGELTKELPKKVYGETRPARLITFYRTYDHIPALLHRLEKQR